MTPWETYDHAGVKIELHYDDDHRCANPRENDNVTTLVCWHPDYILGDRQIRNPDGYGAIGEGLRTCGKEPAQDH